MFDKFKDECGVFGIYGHPEASKLTYLGLYALQHRGQESAGIVSSDGSQLFAHRALGLVQDVFGTNTRVVPFRIGGFSGDNATGAADFGIRVLDDNENRSNHADEDEPDNDE